MKAAGFLVSLVSLPTLIGQEPQLPSLRVGPRVVKIGVPRYPEMSAASGISGTVKFLVRTNGQKIGNILKSQGPPMLVRELLTFLEAWEFEPHTPETFEITFKMKVTHDKVLCPPGAPDEIKLVLPSYVEMTHAGISECDPVIELDQ